MLNELLVFVDRVFRQIASSDSPLTCHCAVKLKVRRAFGESLVHPRVRETI
jgi:hypothetical protein